MKVLARVRARAIVRARARQSGCQSSELVLLGRRNLSGTPWLGLQIMMSRRTIRGACCQSLSALVAAIGKLRLKNVKWSREAAAGGRQLQLQCQSHN